MGHGGSSERKRENDGEDGGSSERERECVSESESVRVFFYIYGSGMDNIHTLPALFGNIHTLPD